MARSVDVLKRRTWSERLQRFARLDQTVAAFCRAEKVSMPSFYQWRRKLEVPKSRRRSDTRRFPRQSFLPVQIVSSRAVAAPVQIEMPNGTRVYLAGDDRGLVAAAIAAAGQAPRAVETTYPAGKEPAC